MSESHNEIYLKESYEKTMELLQGHPNLANQKNAVEYLLECFRNPNSNKADFKRAVGDVMRAVQFESEKTRINERMCEDYLSSLHLSMSRDDHNE